MLWIKLKLKLIRIIQRPKNQHKDMTNTNGQDAATKHPWRDAPSGAARRSLKTTASAASSKGSNKPPPKTTIQTGNYSFIKTAVEPKRIDLQKSMVRHTAIMLKTRGEITKRLKTSSHFAGTYIDKFDLDANAKPKEKISFLPR